MKYPFKDELKTMFRHYEKDAREAGPSDSADSTDSKDTKAEKVEPKEGKGEVYLTASGTKYRTETCRFVAKSKIPCTLAGAKAKKFEPCSMCHPPK